MKVISNNYPKISDNYTADLNAGSENLIHRQCYFVKNITVIHEL
jgi:hypothetical protein